ncbi:MAG: FHA domain-containing protein [Anaerolineae bacterium]|nr:FHA domain-containing protein [Anaerolineae bacterium]
MATESLRKRGTFTPMTNVILQFAPTGTFVSSALDKPLILGRGIYTQTYDTLDLTDLDADRYGVSRQHCLLRRHGTHLTITDLDSSNGTFVNNMRLGPNQEHVLAHNDRLTLGELNVLVIFTTALSR